MRTCSGLSMDAVNNSFVEWLTWTSSITPMERTAWRCASISTWYERSTTFLPIKRRRRRRRSPQRRTTKDDTNCGFLLQTNHSLQRFPQFIHSKNTVIGSSALRVCFCIYCVLSDPQRRHYRTQGMQSTYLKATRNVDMLLVPICLRSLKQLLLHLLPLHVS